MPSSSQLMCLLATYETARCRHMKPCFSASICARLPPQPDTADAPTSTAIRISLISGSIVGCERRAQLFGALYAVAIVRVIDLEGDRSTRRLQGPVGLR